MTLRADQSQAMMRTVSKNPRDRIFDEPVDLPAEFGQWARRGNEPERWVFELTEHGRSFAESLRELYDEADAAWESYRAVHPIRCPASVYRDGYANGLAAAKAKAAKVDA
jgi:hypothetical protein